MKSKNIFYLKYGLFISLGLLISIVSFSQSVTDFSGSWAFNDSKSNLGDGGSRMVSQHILITQDAEVIKFERSLAGQDGTERKLTDTYTLDGKESVNPVFNTSKKSTATWSSDKKSLSVSSVIAFEMNGESNEIKTIEVYNLKDAGKTLTVDTHLTSSMGDRKTLLVYERK